jgi:hypothetical protein
MPRITFLAASLALVSAIAVFAQTKPSIGSVELTDAAGDVGTIQTSSNQTYPGFDVVKLQVVSDGKRITVAATLNAAPADFASDVLELYFDVDNSKETGAALLNPEVGGFEFRGQLDACVAFSDASETCAGGSAKPAAKPERRYAIVGLDRFKGASEIDGRQQVVDAQGFAPIKALQTPIVGAVVQASLDYDALKVSPGRTIRLVVRESSAGTSPTGALQGFFPDVLLTLK